MSYSVTKEVLIKAPLAEQTSSYKPISHEELIELTLNSIQGAGFVLESERYTSAKDGLVGNGRYVISNVADNEMKLQIGWQNSYDKSLSLKWALGAKILICENGVCSGDFGSFKKKHTGDVQTFTPSAITEYIKSAGDVFQAIQKQRDEMKNIEISMRTKAELLGRMYIEEDIIKSTQLNIIEKELKHPTHDYNCKDSLWELYNFVTFSTKDVHPSLWMNNHIDIHNFFVNNMGIYSPKQEIEIPEENVLQQLSLEF